jgi:hypothetical protein
MAEQARPYQPWQPIASERPMLEGALAALNSLHSDLILRVDEARDESARETYEEVLTLLDSLIIEYRRRHAMMPPVSPHHASYVFLLDEQGGIHPLPHRLYVDLVRGKTVTPQFASKTLRLAEWYVRLHQDEPETVVNETYTLLSFDREGRVDWSATPSLQPPSAAAAMAAETAPLPNAIERTQMRALLFGTGFDLPPG